MTKYTAVLSEADRRVEFNGHIPEDERRRVMRQFGVDWAGFPVQKKSPEFIFKDTAGATVPLP